MENERNRRRVEGERKWRTGRGLLTLIKDQPLIRSSICFFFSINICCWKFCFWLWGGYFKNFFTNFLADVSCFSHRFCEFIFRDFIKFEEEIEEIVPSSVRRGNITIITIIYTFFCNIWRDILVLDRSRRNKGDAREQENEDEEKNMSNEGG